jgi:feruloyl esterase
VGVFVNRRASLVVLAATLAAFGTAHAETASDPVARCTAIGKTDFSRLEDAPTQITATSFVALSNATAGYCQVSGYVTPNVGFILRLPSNGWNGKFMEQGCGGYCGSAEIFLPVCDHALKRGYACIVSDNGHQSTPSDAKWAYNDLQAQLDHGYRGAHVTALAGKAIVENYYVRKPKRSYFVGCSAGGRQALMEAQRFPWDFDGIIAGSPSVSVPEHHMAMLWGNRAFTDKAGVPLFGHRELELLHNAVVAKCDLNDGLRDGLIGDPRRCGFDPSELLCKVGSQGACLSAAQVDAAKRIYGGPTTSSGESIYSGGGLMKGSESTWLEQLAGAPGDIRQYYTFPGEVFRYAAFMPSPGPNWKSEDFDFDHDYKRLGVSEGLNAAVNPDLRRFKAAGGKLLSYGGWSDVVGVPLAAVDYYETAEKTMGGRMPTQEFYRFFMLSGMGHCTFGDGAFAVDWLGYLEAWVEEGRVPFKVLSSHVEAAGGALGSSDDATKVFLQRMGGWDYPLDPAAIKFSRPVYPYPTMTRYLGHGDHTDAANFGPTER